MASSTFTISIPFRSLSAHLPPIPLPRFLLSADNRDLNLPEDLLDLVWYTIGWAILHAVLTRYVLEPLSRVLIPPRSYKAEASDVDTSLISSGKSIPRVRARKGANSYTSTASAVATSSNGNARKAGKSGPHHASSTSLSSAVTASSSSSSSSSSASVSSRFGDERAKFVVSAWRFITYGASTLTGLWICMAEDWLLDPSKYYERWAQPGNMSSLVKFYYKLGFGSYLYASISIFFEPRQKDFVVMVSHHFVTIFLIYLSYVYPFYRLGCAILFLHDMSDPIMELAKMALYANRTKIADTLFATFAAVFIVTRNWIFPMYIIRSLPLYAYMPDGTMIPPGKPEVRYAGIACLSLLEVFHIYWASLILKMAKRAILDKGVSDDTRNE